MHWREVKVENLASSRKKEGKKYLVSKLLSNLILKYEQYKPLKRAIYLIIAQGKHQ